LKHCSIWVRVRVRVVLTKVREGKKERRERKEEKIREGKEKKRKRKERRRRKVYFLYG